MEELTPLVISKSFAEAAEGLFEAKNQNLKAMGEDHLRLAHWWFRVAVQQKEAHD